MQASALAWQARAGRQGRATAATVPDCAAAALAAPFDVAFGRLRQARQDIGGQAGQGGFQQQFAHVLRRCFFFRCISWVLGRLGFSGRRLGSWVVFWRRFFWRFGRRLRWRLLLGWCGHLGGPGCQTQTGCAAQVMVFNRIAVAQRRQHTGQAHTGQGTPQTGDAHGLCHLCDGLYLLIIQAQCAQTLQHRLSLFFGLAVGAAQHTQQPQDLVAGFFWPPKVAQIQPDAQTFLQSLSHGRFVFQSLVQSDQPQPCVLGVAAAVGRDAAVVEHLRQNGRRFMGHALGHGGQQKRLVRLRQQTRLGDGSAAVQGGA